MVNGKGISINGVTREHKILELGILVLVTHVENKAQNCNSQKAYNIEILKKILRRSSVEPLHGS